MPHCLISKEATLQLLVAEVEILHRVPDARQVHQLQIDSAGEEVVTHIDVLSIAELSEQIDGIAPEWVIAEVDATKVLELPDPIGREPRGEVVVGEVEVDEAAEVNKVTGDRSVKLVLE
jgi:hypothetical protein